MNTKIKSLSLGLLVIGGNSFAMEQRNLTKWLPKSSVNFGLLSAKAKNFISSHPFISGGLTLGIAGLFTYKFYTNTPAYKYSLLLEKYGHKGQAFQHAIDKNDLKLATYILSQEQPAARQRLANYTNPFDLQNSLSKAITQRNKAMVELLISNGANPQEAHPNAMNALAYADLLRINNHTMQVIYNMLKLAVPVPHISAQVPSMTAGQKALSDELHRLEQEAGQ